jgi:8-oxo-dGTP pyrophosphatase MutT (NUDIX family)
VSFPGGVREPGDASPLDAALREAEEELAIPRARVVPLGTLDDVWVVTGYRLTPFVGRVPADVKIEPNAAEVARAFAVPLAELVDPSRTKVKVIPMVRAGRFLDVPFFEHGGEVIWGATGRALQNLLEVALGWKAPPPEASA